MPKATIPVIAQIVKMASKVRITGGHWRSRLLPVAEAEGLRPTPDRVRETLFNWLGQKLQGLSCLDLFAGSGILGMEAASRGADSVLFIERERKIAASLSQQLTLFVPDSTMAKSPQMQVRCADALNFTPPAPVDLLFLDPPYRQNLLEKIAPRLALLAKPNARLYVEAEFPLTELGDWQVVKSGRAGQVFFHLLEQP